MQGAFPFGLDRGEGLERVLELVVEAGAVEGARAEVLQTAARLPLQGGGRKVGTAVIEGLEGAEIVVQPACGIPVEAVGALVTGGKPLGDASAFQGRGRIGPKGLPGPRYGLCR